MCETKRKIIECQKWATVRDLGNTKGDHLTYHPEMGVAEECQGRESRLEQADRRGGMWYERNREEKETGLVGMEYDVC